MCFPRTRIPVESYSVDACSVEVKRAAACMNTGRKGICAVFAVQSTESSLTCTQCRKPSHINGRKHKVVVSRVH